MWSFLFPAYLFVCTATRLLHLHTFTIVFDVFHVHRLIRSEPNAMLIDEFPCQRTGFGCFVCCFNFRLRHWFRDEQPSQPTLAYLLASVTLCHLSFIRTLIFFSTLIYYSSPNNNSVLGVFVQSVRSFISACIVWGSTGQKFVELLRINWSGNFSRMLCCQDGQAGNWCGQMNLDFIECVSRSREKTKSRLHKSNSFCRI